MNDLRERILPTTLLLAATRPEIVPTVDRLGLRWRDKRQAEGTAAGRHVVARVSGVGASRAVAALERACAEHEVVEVVIIGFAGGLTPRWQGGEVARVSRVLDESGSAIELDAAGDAVLLTLDRMVADVAEKRRLHESFNADMVDMETYALARRVSELATPDGGVMRFVALRAISDPADVALPAEMVNWVDDAGRPRTTAALAWLARHPHRLPMLKRLQRDTRRAADALARAAAERFDST